ncbi:MAG: polyamine aminopropyltransferase [Desulfobacteraceae bacterium]|jgi:spermidine synthase
MTDERKEEIALVDFDSKKDQVIDLWYQDAIEFGHGISLRIKIKNVLYNTRSPYQEITVMETERLGRILVIDGITMLTEWDEYAYHEMISHVPLLVHPDPSRILIIGGGDGGTAREVIKHPNVELVHVCELDEEVVNACRKYLPSLASSLEDPRVKVFYEDGAKFITKHPKSYDVIIVDSTDPLGPGQILFQEPFYQAMKEALTEEGIAVTQCESFFLHQHVIRGVFSFARNLFPKLSYYSTLVPTYPSGVIGFFFCSLKRDPIEDIEEERFGELQGLRYYTPQVHRASFTLPRFAADLLRP